MSSSFEFLTIAERLRAITNVPMVWATLMTLMTLSMAGGAQATAESPGGQTTSQASNPRPADSGSDNPAETRPAAAGAAQNATQPFPEFAIPPQADRRALEKIVAAAKLAQPTDLAQYRAMQTAIRDGSNALLKLIEDENDPVRLQAELDSLSSSAALMVNDTQASREEVLERTLSYLEKREKLTLADVQTGMMVAFYLELQPQKSPARDVYAMIEERLEQDQREEMQALRLNLQANIRRLELLGNKFDLDAKSITGKSIKTDDYTGKFLLVHFFATSAAPSLAEVPRLQKHYAKYRDKGLEVIAISIDTERPALDKYLSESKLPWPTIYDEAVELKDKLQTKFGISSLPYVLLLNKEGVVVSLEARGPELDRLMERIFEAPTPADAPEPATAPQPTPPAAPPKSGDNSKK